MNQHLNPETLSSNPAFSQVVVVEAPARTIYVGGQNAVLPDGSIAGTTLAEQTVQVLRNVKAAVEAAGATVDDIVKWTIYVVDGQSFDEGFAAFMAEWGQRPDPPVITGVKVVALANPQFLVEIDAVAAIPA
jgi:enamine deaminase RidA (YjgF/YER057c/UK114 family)